MITREFDTIAAISTPLGEGAYWYCPPEREQKVLPLRKRFSKERLESGCQATPQLRSH